VIEFDPNAVADAPQVAAMAAGPDAVDVPDDLLQARDELLDRLGGRAHLASFAAAATDYSDQLGFENIQGVGVGVKETYGNMTGDLAVKVLVKEKASSKRISKDVDVPSDVAGIPTDVEEVQEFSAGSFARRFPRPVPGGPSCGHPDITAGTIGCLVVLNNNRLAFLSNNHVLADENDAAAGDFVWQPGRRDGGDSGDVIGQLERFVPLQFGGTNLVDAAVAWTSFSLVSAEHITYQVDPQPRQAAPLMIIKKNGRTTQATMGWVSAIHVDSVAVAYSKGTAVFDDQIIIRSLTSKPFSQGGDSGSLIVDHPGNHPIGLLFGGSTTHTIANPIATVMREMGISRFVEP
jgi:hypothetical protein